MATLLTDAFSGADNSAWDSSKWTQAVASTGASAKVLGTRGRMDPGTLADYQGNITMRYNGTNVADVEISGLVNYYTANDGRLEVWARTDNGGVNPGNGYFLALTKGGTIGLYKAVSFSFLQIASATFSLITATDYKFRFSVVGSAIKARVWGAYDPEPTTWNMSVTDTAVTAAGTTMLSALGGGDPGMIIDVDDIIITDGASSLTTVTKSAAISWDTTALVTGQTSITWDVNALVTKSAPISWDVQSPTLTMVTKSADISWDVRALTTKSAQISWNVLITDDLNRRLWRKYPDGWRSISFSEI